jgi:hypothetical protein
MRSLVYSLLMFVAVQASAQPLEIHGAGDAFVAEGVSIVWGVLRGASEDTTEVRLRVVADPGRYGRLEVVSINPFTGKETRDGAPLGTSGPQIIAIPRIRFAAFPRTEFRFFSSPSDRISSKPELLVYYLGVPDTTPEFNDERALTQRLEGARP